MDPEIDGNKLLFAQWNSRGIRSKIPQLPIILETSDIIIISETWLKPHQRFSLPGFTIIRKDRNSINHELEGGVLIAVRHEIQCVEIILKETIFSIPEFEICAASIKVNKGDKIYIFSGYRPPDNSTSRKSWNKLLRAMKKIAGKNSLIVAGDLNAQASLWGSGVNNPSGKNLVNELRNTDLVVLNDGCSAVAQRKNFTSVPVVTFVSSKIAGNCARQVTEDCLSSDLHNKLRAGTDQSNVFE